MMVFKGACSSSITLNKKLNYMCEVDQQDHQRFLELTKLYSCVQGRWLICPKLIYLLWFLIYKIHKLSRASDIDVNWFSIVFLRQIKRIPFRNYELYLEIVVQGSHAWLQIIFVLLGDFEIQNSLNLKEVSSHDETSCYFIIFSIWRNIWVQNSSCGSWCAWSSCGTALYSLSDVCSET